MRFKSALILLLIIQVIASAQTRSSADSALRVTVVDPAGAAILGASVKINLGGAVLISQTNERGEALFSALTPGGWDLHVEAAGFEPIDKKDITVRSGMKHVDVKMSIARVNEAVVVSEDKLEKKTDLRGDAFSTILTQEQIAALPDDPDEMEQTLRRIGGPGASIRVNGFRGGKLPPKSRIREIRFRMNAYSADNHEPGFGSIDITTKPGIDTWHGTFGSAFRDGLFNARNALAPTRGDEQLRRFNFDLNGPIWKNHTSLFLAAESAQAFDSKTIVAALPGGPFNDIVARPSRTLNLSARIEHVLTKTHTLRAEYQRNAIRLDNLGVGDFDLPDRAFMTDQAEHVLRLADTGMISKRLVNELRFQTIWRTFNESSASNAPATEVLNAFNSGGAQVQAANRTRESELVDNVDFVFGKHQMRAGLSFEQTGNRSLDLRNFGGTFVFSSLAAFQAGAPTTYSRRAGEPAVAYGQYQAGWYWQDDIRLKKNLSVSLGLRQEIQNHIADGNNLAPRLAIAWTPARSGNTTIRAGAGIFYNWFGADVYEQTLRVNGITQRDIVVRNPGFPDPFDGGTETVLPASRIQRDPAMTLPYIEQASVQVERELGKRIRLRTDYFYQRGVHQLRGHNINAPPAGQGRPDPAAGNIVQIESSANTSAHMFGIGLNHFSKRLQFLVNYRLSKGTDEADGPTSLPANNFDLQSERGPSLQDVRHQFFSMMSGNPLGAFRIGAMVFYRSGSPYNITTGFDDNGDTVSNDRPDGIGRNSARGTSQWDVSTRLSWSVGFGKRKESGAGGPRAVLVRINNPGDALGGLPSGAGEGKRFVTEYYIQAYNLLNHSNFNTFSGVETSPFFGRPTAALPGRRLEMGMRFNF